MQTSGKEWGGLGKESAGIIPIAANAKVKSTYIMADVANQRLGKCNGPQ